MQPETAKYLEDIRQACNLVQAYTHGKLIDDYLGDSLLRAGVEREFIIIGEVLSQAAKRDPNVGQSITASAEIIAFCNILAHGYATIRPETVWDIATNDLASLKKQVEDLLAQVGPP